MDRCPGDPGDLIEFRRGSHSHWAVNIGNNETMHLFGTRWSPFSSGTFGTSELRVQVDKFKDVNQDAKSGKGSKVAGCVVGINNSEHSLLPSALPPQVIIERALSQHGQKGYHLLVNNCEHFATWCRYGMGYSKQALLGTFHQPVPNGGTREEVDEDLPRLRSVERYPWCVVMSDKRWEHPVLGASRGWEEYWVKVELPMDTLTDKSEEASISTMSSSPDCWMIGWRPGHLYQRVQEFRGSPPYVANSVADWAEEQARSGYSLTKLGCHGGILVAVSERPKHDELSTTYLCKGNFNCEYLKEARAKGQNVVAVVYFNGWWIIQTSTRVKGQQACIVDDDCPRAMIKEYRDDGFLIQTIAAGPQWVVIMLKTSNSSSMCQSCDMFHSLSEVKQFIKRNWAKNMCITALTGN